MTITAPAHQRLPSPQSITDACSAALAAYADAEGPLLPILHEVQARLGCLPNAVFPIVAEALNISAAEVHGVASFYPDFHTAPAGQHRLKICRAEACQAVGGRVIETMAQEIFGVAWHGTTDDGALTLEPVYCLGLCACGPAAMLDNTPVGRVDAAALQQIKAQVQS